MLSSILRVIYINPEWAAREYLARSKSGNWKHANDDESLKCWNLERILEVEQFFGEVKNADLRMDELLGELEEDDLGSVGSIEYYALHDNNWHGRRTDRCDTTV